MAAGIAPPAIVPPGRPGAGTLRLALRFARRELRGGTRGFRIFLACLALGVAAIAGVGSLSSAMLDGLQANARALLGGEVELRLVHRAANDEELAWLAAHSRRLSATAELRTMARNSARPAERRLVELKAVDAAYPLYGRLESAPPLRAEAAFARRDGHWGALVDPGLLARLGLAVGDRLSIGALDYEVRGTVTHEPDRAARIFTLGPRVLVARDSLAATGLEQPGSLIYHHYRLDLPAGTSLADWRAVLDAALPHAGWRVRGLDEANPGIQRFVDQVGVFMTLVGLTALLVGGVGVAGAVASFLERRKATIATLKCLGAPARLVFATYLAQVLALALLGIVVGLALGAQTPLLLGPFLAARLNFDLAGGLHVGPLALAALFGLLTTLAFSLWPLARAQQVPAASLFRDLVQPARTWPPLWAILAVAAAGAALAGVAVLGTERSLFAAKVLGGTAAALVAFRLLAAGLVWGARRLPRARRPDLRLAIANLHRPGAPTGSIVTSLGLGLTVLVAVALIEGNISRRVLQDMPAEAPAFYFIDIQPDQAEAFEALVRAAPGVTAVDRVPMLRGRITAVNGVSPAQMELPQEVQWVFRGDRGLTWAARPPAGTELTAGAWWPADYDGPPLVSLADEVARHLDLGIGDRLTVNLLGRDIEVEIANLRRVEWEDLTINFVMIFSPGLLARAPQTAIATVQVAADREAALERRVTDAFPNVSAIRVKEALQSFAEMLDSIAGAVTATAGVTLLAGVLVLAGAVAAGHRRRLYDAVVLKVLGATRRDIARAFLIEHGLIGLVTAAIAALFGTLAAWWVVEAVLQGEFHFMAGRVLETALAALFVTLLFGFFGTWRALSQRAAPLLRNE